MSLLGIDPGLNGGLCAMHSPSLIEVQPMPVTEGGEIDTAIVRTILIAAKPSHVYIEKAQPMMRPGQTGGIKQTFAFGVGYGKLKAIIEVLGYPYTEVRPQTWKAAVLVDMDKSVKASSVNRARQLFPHVDFRRNERCRSDHDGCCEAALIAWYGWTIGRG